MGISKHLYGLTPSFDSISRQRLTPSDILFKPLETVLAPGVLRKYQGGREYSQFDTIPMQDWDYPDAIHHSNSITINNLGDVYPLLDEHARRNNESWRLYSTPGGVRAFNLSTQASPSTLVNDQPFSSYLQAQLNSDPLYANFSLEKNTWASRLSQKPKRSLDYVAYPLGIVGQGPLNPTNLDIIRRFHDVPIIENRYVSKLSPHTIPRIKALELAERHLSKVPRHFAAPIEARLESQGLL